jgi:peptide/nickel transport system ATP-binding protein
MSALLSVERLNVEFAVTRGLGRTTRIRAVNGVSFEVAHGSTFGIVGESGSGKSTLAHAILGLAPISSGVVALDGQPVQTRTLAQRRALARNIQIVFQDPLSSLDPRMRVWEIVAEPLYVAGVRTSAKLRAHAAQLLDRVGIADAHLDRLPHEFSGGQRQRIAIARALALGPCLVVLDEPTSALDVSVQAQILNLLLELQQNAGLAYLLISHDIGVVKHLATDIAVMRHGEIVEQGPAARVLAAPEHEYTRQLVGSVYCVDKPRAFKQRAAAR